MGGETEEGGAGLRPRKQNVQISAVPLCLMVKMYVSVWMDDAYIQEYP